MIYWFTGQPGHGKTLHAIEKAMEYKDQGRLVYVCNVRDFDYEKTGMHRMTPEQFRDWPSFLPDGAVALVDEAYEHDMLPKRPPGAKVPHHVEQLAKHRHRGLDFIFVSQSPDKQCDAFVHDLIERHVHVRRRFGTKYVHLREFDRFERNPEKATPLTVKRTTLPKRPMGSYKSTELDTTERRIPWYYIAFALGLPGGLLFFLWVFGGLSERLGGGEVQAATGASPAAMAANGASATVAAISAVPASSAEDHLTRFLPRVASQPWSAPAYDELPIPSDPPRVFCMSAAAGALVDGSHAFESCTCLTEQGTRYVMPYETCHLISRRGQYEPLFDERSQRTADAQTQMERNREAINRRAAGAGVVIAGEAAPQ